MTDIEALFSGLAIGCVINVAIIEIRIRMEARRWRNAPPLRLVPYANAERTWGRRDEDPS